MKHSKTLNSFAFLFFLAVPLVGSPKQQIYSAADLFQVATSNAQHLWGNGRYMQLPPSSRPVMTSAMYSPQETAAILPEEVTDATSGRGIWLQITAGCGLLLFGALRRIFGL